MQTNPAVEQNGACMPENALQRYCRSMTPCGLVRCFSYHNVVSNCAEFLSFTQRFTSCYALGTYEEVERVDKCKGRMGFLNLACNYFYRYRCTRGDFDRQGS